MKPLMPSAMRAPAGGKELGELLDRPEALVHRHELSFEGAGIGLLDFGQIGQVDHWH